MQTRDLPTNQNGAKSVADRAPKSSLVRIPVTLEQLPPAAVVDRGELASARIRRAQDILRALLVEDELAGETGSLSGSIAVRLDGIQLELSQLSGLQQLFELWSTGEVKV